MILANIKKIKTKTGNISKQEKGMASSSSALSRLSNLQGHLHPSHSNKVPNTPITPSPLFLSFNHLVFFFFLTLSTNFTFLEFLFSIFFFKGGVGFIKISPEVSEALSNGHAVVALESTIISHGNSLSLSHYVICCIFSCFPFPFLP